MHVAAALDVPLAAIFGSSSPEHTPPLGTRVAIESLRLPCAPCFRRSCPLGHTRCLTDIEPARVLAALGPFLAREGDAAIHADATPRPALSVEKTKC
jgi:heptosyltransferase-2